MDEAERIYHSIFKAEIPIPLKERFYRASKKLASNCIQEEVTKYNRVIRKVSDLEALELTARHLNKYPLLVLKFKLMIYLAETLPQNRKYYINKRDIPLVGWICLFFGGFRTTVKFLKGLFLLIVLKNV